jgi:hypothetical protein
MRPQAIDHANRDALEVIAAARPVLLDIQPARDVIPALGSHDLLHAGPPFAHGERLCGALRGAVAGALQLEGVQADLQPESFDLPLPWRLRSADECSALGTFGGIISPSSAVFVVENTVTGTRTFSAINEGRGAALRYGSTAPQTLERMRWLDTGFAALLGATIRHIGPIEIFPLIEQALQMGDDGHSRQKAASALFLAVVAPALPLAAASGSEASRTLTFLADNDFFFLPLAMAAAKSAMRAAEGTEGSTLVTAIAFNGARSGIRLAGKAGWATGPLPEIQGAYFRDGDPRDAGPVIGDSEIMETIGLGACAMAGAPALARYVGGSISKAAAFTDEMYAITLAEHPRFRIPALDSRGTPFGIDARKVIDTGIAPVFNTGIAHRDPGVGQIGAGYGRVPFECFRTALGVDDCKRF